MQKILLLISETSINSWHKALVGAIKISASALILIRFKRSITTHCQRWLTSMKTRRLQHAHIYVPTVGTCFPELWNDEDPPSNSQAIRRIITFYICAINVIGCSTAFVMPLRHGNRMLHMGAVQDEFHRISARIGIWNTLDTLSFRVNCQTPVCRRLNVMRCKKRRFHI
jgi:hypothetical protein